MRSVSAKMPNRAVKKLPFYELKNVNFHRIKIIFVPFLKKRNQLSVLHGAILFKFRFVLSYKIDNDTSCGSSLYNMVRTRCKIRIPNV